jgi:hypothetical protein
VHFCTVEQIMSSSYRSRPLDEYDINFREVADAIAHALRQRHPDAFSTETVGSYSFRHNRQTAVKIIIFQRDVGHANREPLPLHNDGVYILLRSNDELGRQFSESLSPLITRLSEENLGVAPNHDEMFRFFPVMAGERLQALCEALSGLMHMLPAAAA